MSRTAAILLAGGRSRRMAGAVEDKVLAPLGHRPVFAHTVAAFEASGVADLYVIVYRDQAQLQRLQAWAPTPSAYARGGRERQDSVAAGLEALPPDVGYVFIHDCARPLVRPEQLVGLLKIVRREDAVVLAHRVTDTIKEHRGEGSLRTLDRDHLWAMETPQVFATELIIKAYARAAEREVRLTDDAAAVELLRHPVALLENNYPNPKITTPDDLALCEFILNRREPEPAD